MTAVIKYIPKFVRDKVRYTNKEVEESVSSNSAQTLQNVEIRAGPTLNVSVRDSSEGKRTKAGLLLVQQRPLNRKIYVNRNIRMFKENRDPNWVQLSPKQQPEAQKIMLKLREYSISGIQISALFMYLNWD